jgi:hypothetical protein
MIRMFDYANDFAVEEVNRMKGDITRHIRAGNHLDPEVFPRYQTKTDFLEVMEGEVWDKLRNSWKDAFTKYRDRDTSDVEFVKSWALMIPPGFQPESRPWHMHKHDTADLYGVPFAPIATSVFYLDPWSGTEIMLEGERYDKSDITVISKPKVCNWMIMPNDVNHRPADFAHIMENRYTIVVDAYDRLPPETMR